MSPSSTNPSPSPRVPLSRKSVEGHPTSPFLTSPRSVRFSPRVKRQNTSWALSGQKSPGSNLGLLEKRTTTLPFFRLQEASPRRTAKSSEYEDLVKLKEWKTVVGIGQSDVFCAPAFLTATYGKEYHRDIIVFFTNALRHETKGLFFMLYCLHERADSIEEGDIESFFEWYTPYHNFFTTVLSVLQATFLPWVERSADLPPSASRAYLNAEGSRLQRIVRKTLRHQRSFLKKYEPAKASAKLRHLFLKFAAELLSYLSKLEDGCSLCIESQYSIEECRDMSRALVAEIATMPDFKKNIVLMLRWLDNRPETAAAWRRANLDTRTGLSYPVWKRPGAQEECASYFLRKCKAIPQHMEHWDRRIF